MKQQQTLAGFEKYGKTTRRAQFLGEMERVVPWTELAVVIKPLYPSGSAEIGRPLNALERMLRITFLQAWFNLSNPAVEEALYDSAAMRSVVGINLDREPAPDETNVCKIRHRLEKHGLGKKLFASVVLTLPAPDARRRRSRPALQSRRRRPDRRRYGCARAPWHLE